MVSPEIRFIECESCGGFGPTIDGKCPGCLEPRPPKVPGAVWLMLVILILYPITFHFLMRMFPVCP